MTKKPYEIIIENDVFNIANRLKNVDENYYILFNQKSKKFQVHNSAQGKNSFCLSLPYLTLDARAIEYVLKTHVRNFNKIVLEIEKNNSKIECANARNIEDIAAYKFADFYKFASASTLDITSAKTYSNEWI